MVFHTLIVLEEPKLDDIQPLEVAPWRPLFDFWPIFASWIFGDFGPKIAKMPIFAHFSSEKLRCKDVSKCIVKLFFVFRKSLGWFFIP